VGFGRERVGFGLLQKKRALSDKKHPRSLVAYIPALSLKYKGPNNSVLAVKSHLQGEYENERCDFSWLVVS